MNIVSKVPFIEGKFYTLDEIGQIQGPEDPRWTLEKRNYCGQDRYVYIYNFSRKVYTEIFEEDDEDSEDDDWVPEEYELEEDKEEDDAIVTELHNQSTECPLIGGGRSVVFSRRYISDGNMTDFLEMRQYGIPQISEEWTCAVHVLSEYFFSAQLAIEGTDIVSKVARVAINQDPCILQVRGNNSLVKVRFDYCPIDGGAADFVVEVSFFMEENTTAVYTMTQPLTGDGKYIFCQNGMYPSRRRATYRHRKSLLKFSFPFYIKPVIWGYLRKYYGQISGLFQFEDEGDQENKDNVEVWIEGTYNLLRLIESEINKFCVFQTYIKGEDVRCMQPFSAIVGGYMPLCEGIPLVKLERNNIVDMEVTVFDCFEDRTVNPILILHRFVEMETLQYQEYGDDLVIYRSLYMLDGQSRK